ncbi:MAG TPA: GEVED domain-containing protein [Flavobacteriales bacterium]|nr:GEVED domain-containing protein [Flavobacteriales bacterium]
MTKKILATCFVLFCMFQGFAQFPAPYCAETFPDLVEPITLVDFAGINNPSAAPEGGTNEHEDFTAMTGNVIQGNSYTITLKGNTAGPFDDYFSVFIDWNQDGSFDVSETYDLGFITDSDGLDAVELSASINVPVSAMVGTTRMRVTKLWDEFPLPCNTSGYGQSEDYSISVTALSGCSGTPTAGTASAPGFVCDTTALTLNLTGYTLATGITVQWQSSTDNITYANIPTGTTVPFTTTQTDSMYYRAVVTCTTSGMTDTSNVLYVDMIQCVCQPFYDTGTDEGDYIGLVQLGSINNITGGAPSPYYTLYSTPTTSLSKLTSYTLTVAAGTYGTNDLAAWIDYNQDGVFDLTEKLGESDDLADYPASDAYTFIVPASALTGTTILRVRELFGGAPDIDPCADGFYGEIEDYIVTILPAPPCVNTPVGGTVSGTTADSVGSVAQYVLTGENGDNIQWYISTDGGLTYAPIAGATNDTLNYTIAGMTDFSLYAVLFSPGCTSDTSNIFTTTVISNDNACNAFPLVMGTNGPYSTVGATVESGEIYPMGGDCITQQTWCNNTLDGTVWFTFTAPASGRVSIQSPGFDTQLALWKADNCADLYNTSVVEFVAANDDDTAFMANGGAEYSSFIQGTYCLVPGATYYLQLDAYFDPGVTEVILTDIGAPTSPAVTLADQTFCGSTTLDASNVVPGTTYEWSTGDTTQTVSFTASDTVWVTVTDSLNCTASDTAVLTSQNPDASFMAALVTGGTYNFTNTGNPTGGAFGTTYSWDFGDGGNSSLENPTHTYPANGTFTVIFTVTNSCGSVASTQTITVTTVAVSEVGNVSAVQVYPNPSAELFNVTANQNIQHVYLVNASGQRVLSMTNVNATKAEMNIAAIARGMYFMEVVTSGGTWRQQVSIIK